MYLCFCVHVLLRYVVIVVCNVSVSLNWAVPHHIDGAVVLCVLNGVLYVGCCYAVLHFIIKKLKCNSIVYDIMVTTSYSCTRST